MQTANDGRLSYNVDFYSKEGLDDFRRRATLDGNDDGFGSSFVIVSL